MNAVDLFAGAGGWSHGWRIATGVEPLLAVNHDAHAVRLHELNHPGTEHFLEDIWSVDPAAAVAGRRVDWLHLSPDCTHFSRAKGGRPREQKIRGLAWVGIDWARTARPRVLSLENVAEFATWGPLDELGQPIRERAGETFSEFVAALRGLGYAVEWRVLCAADFGAPTIRRRLFLIARCDGQPIRWPEPTHGAGRALPWRSAAECIDWSLPCPSIFGRTRPLAAATCRRIAAGVVRFVLQGKPFLAPMRPPEGGAPDRVAAFLAQHFTGMVGKPLTVPMPTVTAIDHHSLVAASLIQTGYGERKGQAPRALDIEQPLGTIVAGGAKHGLVAAFLTQYYGSGGQHSRLDAPLPTVVTRARHGLVTVPIDGRDYVLADIGLRMLTPRELARAQGFPDTYVLEGSKAQQIARIGNSVCPQVAAAIVRANLGQEARVA